MMMSDLRIQEYKIWRYFEVAEHGSPKNPGSASTVHRVAPTHWSATRDVMYGSEHFKFSTAESDSEQMFFSFLP